MKKIIFIFICAMVFISCRDKKSDCIKKGMKDGLPYEEAKIQCEEVMYDSQIR